MLPLKPAARRRGERGVVLVVTALAMVAILIVVGLVLDFGNVRNTRQDAKRVADVAATAGLQALASPDGVPRPWRGVCAALGYLRSNEPDLTLDPTYRNGAGGAAPSSDPCSTIPSTTCTPNAPSSWAWIHVTSGSFAADIRSGYDFATSGFAEDATTYANGDRGLAARGGCDNLAVIIHDDDPAFFGGVVGSSSYDSVIRSVGRVNLDSRSQGVPAFLMLERTACAVLWEQTGAQTNPASRGIQVLPASNTDPGVIHVDSSGTGSGCNPTGPCNKDNYAVSSSDSAYPKIVAMDAPDGTPGIVAIHAMDVGGAAACDVPPAAGVSPAPSTADVVSRKPVDDKYNTNPATISTIHAAAQADAVRTTAPAGYTLVTDCTNPPADALNAIQVFVNCSTFTPNNVTFANATDIIFNGKVSVGNGNSLFLPTARRVVIGGPSTDNALYVAGGGRFTVNAPAFTDSQAGAAAACDGRRGPGSSPAGTWDRTAQLVIFGGSGDTKPAMEISGRAALCQTFVYLAGPKASTRYSRMAITDGSYDTSCTPDLPCPTSTGTSGAGFKISGNASYVVWSAPNQLATQPAQGAAGLEDLALWTETSSATSVTGNGTLDAFGVFFLPNSNVVVSAPSSPSPRDAQFICRTLGLTQGFFVMKPTPGNNVQIPFVRSIALVR